MSGVTITCLCGHTGDFEAFTKTALTGDLPRDVFQCPKCRRAITRRHGPPKVLASGFVLPGEVRLVEVPAFL